MCKVPGTKIVVYTFASHLKTTNSKGENVYNSNVKYIKIS